MFFFRRTVKMWFFSFSNRRELRPPPSRTLSICNKLSLVRICFQDSGMSRGQYMCACACMHVRVIVNIHVPGVDSFSQLGGGAIARTVCHRFQSQGCTEVLIMTWGINKNTSTQWNVVMYHKETFIKQCETTWFWKVIWAARATNQQNK